MSLLHLLFLLSSSFPSSSHIWTTCESVHLLLRSSDLRPGIWILDTRQTKRWAGKQTGCRGLEAGFYSSRWFTWHWKHFKAKEQNPSGSRDKVKKKKKKWSGKLSNSSPRSFNLCKQRLRYVLRLLHVQGNVWIIFCVVRFSLPSLPLSFLHVVIC